METNEHWENVHQTKSSAEVSWYEPEPKQSLDLILDVAADADGRVIDVGGSDHERTVV